MTRCDPSCSQSWTFFEGWSEIFFCLFRSNSVLTGRLFYIQPFVCFEEGWNCGMLTALNFQTTKLYRALDVVLMDSGSRPHSHIQQKTSVKAVVHQQKNNITIFTRILPSDWQEITSSAWRGLSNATLPPTSPLCNGINNNESQKWTQPGA